MLTDIWASVGEFVCEHYAIGLVIGLIVLVVFEVTQYIVNTSMEADIEELMDRVEALEKACREAVFNPDEETEKEGE